MEDEVERGARAHPQRDRDQSGERSEEGEALGPEPGGAAPARSRQGRHEAREERGGDDALGGRRLGVLVTVKQDPRVNQ